MSCCGFNLKGGSVTLLNWLQMGILHLATDDTTGGAARAAYRQHAALRKYGTDSRCSCATNIPTTHQLFNTPEISTQDIVLPVSSGAHGSAPKEKQ